MKRTVATVGLVCALMIGCMGMPPVRAAESDTDKVTTDIGTKVRWPVLTDLDKQLIR